MAGKKKAQPVVAPVDSAIFGGFDMAPLEDEGKPKAAPAKLDLFKEVLPAIHRTDWKWYARLPDERKKQFAPYVVQRWLSNGTDHDQLHHYFLSMTNDMINKNFWSVSSHPELQYMLMCAVAMGTGNARHNWLPMMDGKKKKSPIRDFIRESHPGLSDTEVDILINSTSDAEFRQLLERAGTQDADIKDRMKQWKAEKK